MVEKNMGRNGRWNCSTNFYGTIDIILFSSVSKLFCLDKYWHDAICRISFRSWNASFFCPLVATCGQDRWCCTCDMFVRNVVLCSIRRESSRIGVFWFYTFFCVGYIVIRRGNISSGI